MILIKFLLCLLIFCVFLFLVMLVRVFISYGDVEGFEEFYLNFFFVYKLVSKFFGILFVVLLVGDFRMKVLKELVFWKLNVC